MVLITELQNAAINMNIRNAKYTEGPDRFDEWYQLVREKYPNVKKIVCSGNQLVSINCTGDETLHCENNQLEQINCPNVRALWCKNNRLVHLDCPNAEMVYCKRNKLISINCPIAKIVECNNNRLTQINFPNVKRLRCSNNWITTILCPCAEEIFCCDNPIEYIDAPKLKYLMYNSPDAIIPLELKNVRIYNNRYHSLNYEDICERIIARKQQNIKSARK